MGDLLLELRCEEIPANALAGARRQLADGLARVLAEVGFTAARVWVFSTARRLAVRVDGLPPRQEDRTERLTGPPRSAAFAADGTPKPAAEGFARKLGVAVERLETVRTDKGEYLAATITIPGRPTAEVLSDALPRLIMGLHFPKTMRWGRGEHSFVRPVHGLLALLDGEVLPLEVLGCRSGRTTVGHRVHAPEAFVVAHPDEYVDALAERTVMVEPEARRHILEQRADELAREVGCRVHPDPALVAEHVELVEYPRLLCGEIDTRFLELPREVVITTLRHHQKCLVLEWPDGSLAPYFLAVIDRSDDPKGLICQGNQWVIGARLADAAFFFAEDRKRRLAELVPRLERLDFHRRLGSMAAKAGRAGELAVFMAEQARLGLDAGELQRVAQLAKADLVTHMVGEFPELQGVMGGHYLRLAGEPEAVWTAARDHYTPQGFDGEIPASDLGRAVGAADRLDSVAGLFAVGEVPSGSRDPFGLRRAAQGLVRIVADAGWELDLEAAARRALELVGAAATRPADEVHAEVVGFLGDRVRRWLVERVEVAADTADAVMAAGWGSLPGLAARATALEGVRGQARFRALALAFKRVRNITQDQADVGVDPERLVEPAERALHDASRRFHDALESSLARRDVAGAFAAMGELADELDRFFVEVLVMAPDERTRANRIALLKALGRDFLTLADLSKLQVEGAE